MKKFKIIYLALLLPIFASTCGEEEVTPETVEWYEEVYGKWYFPYSPADGTDLTEAGVSWTLEFKVDGDLIQTRAIEADSFSETDKLKWKSAGDNKLEVTTGEGSIDGIWPDEMTWTITELTESKMFVDVTCGGCDMFSLELAR